MEENILGRIIILAIACGAIALFIYFIKVPYNINRIANSLEDIVKIMKKNNKNELEEDKTELDT